MLADQLFELTLILAPVVGQVTETPTFPSAAGIAKAPCVFVCPVTWLPAELTITEVSATGCPRSSTTTPVTGYAAAAADGMLTLTEGAATTASSSTRISGRLR